MRLSVIVPVLGEEAILWDFLQHLREYVPGCEMIVVDGGSEDSSFAIAQKLSDKAVQSQRGRAAQMNTGAKLANGDVLWFVHADSTVARSSVQAIEEALRDSRCVGGCFRLKIDSPRAIYRIRDAIGNLFVNLTGVALGDRGIFCRRETFVAVGGYPEIAILEDAELYRRLKSKGRVVQLHAIIRTSPRRYEKLGPAVTILFYALIMLLYVTHVPIAALERMVLAYMRHRQVGGRRAT
jgi:rSAM/selenodomain-associated transferase 2